MDVYIDIAPRYKAWLQDVSPYLQGSQRLESALLTWDELSQLEVQRKEQGEAFVPEFRTADQGSNLRQKKDYASRFPVEI